MPWGRQASQVRRAGLSCIAAAPALSLLSRRSGFVSLSTHISRCLSPPDACQRSGLFIQIRLLSISYWHSLFPLVTVIFVFFSCPLPHFHSIGIVCMVLQPEREGTRQVTKHQSRAALPRVPLTGLIATSGMWIPVY